MASQGKFWQESTSSLENQATLRNFRLLLESCYGPKGGIKMIVSGGGYLTVTSASSQLVKNIPFNHPIISLILNFIKSHNCVYEDDGLFIGILSSYMVEKVWTFNGKPSIHKTLKYVCDRCFVLLESGSVEAGLASVEHLLAVSNSVLASKPVCGLSKEEIHHISIQLVKGFLMCVGADAEKIGLGRVVVVQQTGSTINTQLINGLLYPYPEEDALTLKLCEKTRGPWHLLLYTCMLTALPSAAQEVDSIEISSSLIHFNPIVSHFISLLPHFIHADIHLIACQKVVHPEIHLVFRRAGIVILHRLGTELAQGLERMSGAHAIDTPTAAWRECVGRVDSVIPVQHHGKLYLELSREETDVSTLLLCNPLPQAANETEVVVKQALAAFGQLMVQPRLVPGGGCYESWLATKLREDILSDVEHIGHRKSDIQAVVTWIEDALLRIPRLISGLEPWDLHRDSTSNHVWQDSASTCMCYTITRDSVANATWTELPLPCVESNCVPPTFIPTDKSIVDVYRAKASAIRHAFEACQAVIAVSNIIHT